MSMVKVVRILDRDEAIAGLTRLREEWHDAANGAPLINVEASIGLLLIDVVNAIGLLPEEAAQVLGEYVLIPSAQIMFMELAEA